MAFFSELEESLPVTRQARIPGAEGETDQTIPLSAIEFSFALQAR